MPAGFRISRKGVNEFFFFVDTELLSEDVYVESAANFWSSLKTSSNLGSTLLRCQYAFNHKGKVGKLTCGRSKVSAILKALRSLDTSMPSVRWDQNP